MNGRVNVLFVDEYGRPFGMPEAPEDRVNDLLALAAPAGSAPSGWAAPRALPSTGWERRSAGYGQAYLDSVLARPAPARRSVDPLAGLGLDANAPAVPEPTYDGPVMPASGRAYRDAVLDALPEHPGGGHRFAVLPLSTDADGTPHVAVPGIARDLAAGGADLMDAFANAMGRRDFLTGAALPATVTPQAALTMLGLMGVGAPVGAVAAGGSRTAAAGTAMVPEAAEGMALRHVPRYDPQTFRADYRSPKQVVANQPPQRPITSDYAPQRWPDGPPVDPATGRLTHTMDGTPVQAGTVVGRYEGLGAVDAPVANETLDALAAAVTGRDVARVAPNSAALNRGEADGTIRLVQRDPTGARTGDWQINIADDLTPESFWKTLKHELGHGIDLQPAFSGFDMKGLNTQLGQIYHGMTTGTTGTRLLNTPKADGYIGASVQADELRAEAVRAYLTDPNWLKTNYPAVAARIRAHVNEHPFLSKIIQFNSAGDPVAAAALSAAGQAGGASAAAQGAAPRQAQDGPAVPPGWSGMVDGYHALGAGRTPPVPPLPPRYDAQGRMVI